MDPDTTLAELNAAIEAKDWDAAVERLQYLKEWTERGGFEPALYQSTLDTFWYRLDTAEKAEIVMTVLRRRNMELT